MVDTVESRLQECVNEVNNSRYHHLSFKSRRLLFESMNQEIQGDWQCSINISKANYVRTQIAILTTKKVLPIWEKYIKANHPHRILEKCDGYLDGSISREDLLNDRSGFRGGLDNAETDEDMLAYPVGRASVEVATVVLFDENVLDEQIPLAERDDPQDHDNFDCACWVANAISGGYPGVENFDAQKNLEFWTWYLNEAIPTALAKIA